MPQKHSNSIAEEQYRQQNQLLIRTLPIMRSLERSRKVNAHKSLQSPCDFCPISGHVFKNAFSFCSQKHGVCGAMSHCQNHAANDIDTQFATTAANYE